MTKTGKGFKAKQILHRAERDRGGSKVEGEREMESERVEVWVGHSESARETEWETQRHRAAKRTAHKLTDSHSTYLPSQTHTHRVGG